MGIFYKIPLYCFGKALHEVSGYWIQNSIETREPLAFQTVSLPGHLPVPRGNNSIIDIEEQPSVSFFVQLLIIDPIRRIQIFIRKKHLNIYSTSVLSYRSQRGIYSASGRTFLYVGTMILSTLISSSIRCALQPTIRAIANIGV